MTVCSKVIDTHIFRHVTNNQLERIPSRAFYHNGWLKQLYLGSNLLSTLEEDAFFGLNSLEEL